MAKYTNYVKKEKTKIMKYTGKQIELEENHLSEKTQNRPKKTNMIYIQLYVDVSC